MYQTEFPLVAALARAILASSRCHALADVGCRRGLLPFSSDIRLLLDWRQDEHAVNMRS